MCCINKKQPQPKSVVESVAKTLEKFPRYVKLAVIFIALKRFIPEN